MSEKPKQRFKALSYGVRALVAVVLLGGGVALSRVIASTKPPSPEATSVDSRPLVKVLEVRPVEMPRVWSGYGTARSRRVAEVAAEVAALVLERPDDTEAGRPVAAGQVLFRLDDRDLRARVLRVEGQIAAVEAQLAEQRVTARRLDDQVALAEDEVETARRDYERAVEIGAVNAATESEIDNRRAALNRAERTLVSLLDQAESMPARDARLGADLDALRADLETARRDVERCRVGAPFDGRLQEVFVEAGERVALGEPLARVVDLSRVEVPVRLPASAGASVSVGDRVVLTSDAGESRVWEGRIARIAPETDAATRSMTVFAEVTQDAGTSKGSGPGSALGGLLLPGRFVSARVEVSDGRRRLAVPRRVVDGDRVLLVRGGQDEAGEPASEIDTVRVDVLFHADREMPGLLDGERDWAIVSGGLEPGDLVVVSGRTGLVDGRLVRLEQDGVDEGGPVRGTVNGGGVALEGDTP
ncbi:MAG: HlyD family efflux transporter periplasmic adaptor subunit [Planctomycetota bacterium]